MQINVVGRGVSKNALSQGCHFIVDIVSLYVCWWYQTQYFTLKLFLKVQNVRFCISKLFWKFTHNSYKETRLTAVWLAQLRERRSAEREVAGQNPDRTNTQSSTHILWSRHLSVPNAQFPKRGCLMGSCSRLI